MAFPVVAALGLASSLAGMFGKKPKQQAQPVGFAPYESSRRGNDDGELERLLRVRAMLQAISGNSGGM